MKTMSKLLVICLFVFTVPALGRAQDVTQYRLIAATHASALQQEMQDAAREGFRFSAISGGATPWSGKEVVVVMRKDQSATQLVYRVVTATNTTAVEAIQQVSDAGFRYLAQTVFTIPMGGNQVAVLFEHDPSARAELKYQYHLLVTTRITTMQKELEDAGQKGYQLLGLTAGRKLIGLNDIVAVMRRRSN
jgi:hypothetical protein